MFRDLLSLVMWSCMFWLSVTWNLRKTMQCSKSIKEIPNRRLQSLSPALHNLWILQVQYCKLVLIHVSPVSYRSVKGGYHCLPSMPWAYLGVIVSSLCDENLNFTLSSGEIFTALRMRFGGKVNLSVISHLSLGGQNDSLIKLSCFLWDLTVWPFSCYASILEQYSIKHYACTFIKQFKSPIYYRVQRKLLLQLAIRASWS